LNVFKYLFQCFYIFGRKSRSSRAMRIVIQVHCFVSDGVQTPDLTAEKVTTQ